MAERRALQSDIEMVEAWGRKRKDGWKPYHRWSRQPP
jgi:hypothetical protein